MPSVSTCAGCYQPFTVPGLASHLKQTQNPRCKAVFEADYGYVPEDDDILPDPSQISCDSFTDDYGPDNFARDAEIDEENMDLDDQDLPPDSDVDEDDIDPDCDFEDPSQDPDIGWEPPVTEQDMADLDAHDFEDPENVHPPPIASQCSAAHDALQNPRYVENFNDKYAHAQAGMCVGSRPDMNTTYQSRLPDNTMTWAPFSSKLDWEIARWAKLRGPSSTAFSELLAIEGVSAARLIQTHTPSYDFICRFMNV